MSRTALCLEPHHSTNGLKKKCIYKNNQLNYHFKGSKFDLINSDDASKYYTAKNRFRIQKRIKLFLEQFDVIVKPSFHSHLRLR